MDDTMRRIQHLEDLNELRRLKFDYTWNLDTKQWDAFAQCFTEDFVFHTNGQAIPRDAFIANVSASLADVRTTHELHQDSLEIDGDDTAHGTWRLRDHLVSPGRRSEFRGRGIYEETYRRVSGRWLISSTRLSYLSSEGTVAASGDDTKVTMGLVLPSQ